MKQIKEIRPVVDIVDRSASLNRKGDVIWDQDNLRDAPIWKDRVDL
jgi:calcium permeable stress-gated cation channel